MSGGGDPWESGVGSREFCVAEDKRRASVIDSLLRNPNINSWAFVSARLASNADGGRCSLNYLFALTPASIDGDA